MSNIIVRPEEEHQDLAKASSLIVRESTEADIPSIAEIRVKGWENTYRGLMPDEILDSMSIEKDIEGMKGRLPNPAELKVMYVAEEEGNVIGFIRAGKSRDENAPITTGEVTAFYVHPDHQGKGAGTLMMEKALEFLDKKGFTDAILWVLTNNDKTRRWYEHKNWKTEGEIKMDDRFTPPLNETKYFIKL